MTKIEYYVYWKGDQDRAYFIISDIHIGTNMPSLPPPILLNVEKYITSLQWKMCFCLS